jgi:hypothetical protein
MSKVKGVNKKREMNNGLSSPGAGEQGEDHYPKDQEDKPGGKAFGQEVNVNKRELAAVEQQEHGYH